MDYRGIGRATDVEVISIEVDRRLAGRRQCLAMARVCANLDGRCLRSSHSE